MLAALALTVAACGPPEAAPPSRYAGAAQVEENFTGQTFVLGSDNSVALVRPLSWEKDRFLKLPFWLGMNILVPGVLQPKEGEYFVISEAELVEKLEDADEWRIEAGSSLLKKEAILVTARTRYKSKGRILPTIVQFVGLREVKAPNGKMVQIPVLKEISLPMKWTLPGQVPKAYARFETR